jgi:NAD(P)-dependent dehydrogenase (short-subunit alcohol dehydrogenase family)
MRTVLVTGGHSGIGLVGAKTLAERYKCDLILAGRNLERTEATDGDWCTGSSARYGSEFAPVST